MSLPTAGQGLAEYMTVSEAAKFLGVSTWTLRNWDRAGKLKPRRHPINGHRLYRHADLESVLDLVRGRDRLTPIVDWAETAESDHFVQFYEADEFLVDSVAGFIGTGLDAGDGGIVIASPAHLGGILAELTARGVDV